MEINKQMNETDFPDRRDQLLDLLHKYEEIVALKGDQLGATDIIKHHISIPPGTPPTEFHIAKRKRLKRKLRSY